MTCYKLDTKTKVRLEHDVDWIFIIQPNFIIGGSVKDRHSYIMANNWKWMRVSLKPKNDFHHYNNSLQLYLFYLRNFITQIICWWRGNTGASPQCGGRQETTGHWLRSSWLSIDSGGAMNRAEAAPPPPCTRTPPPSTLRYTRLRITCGTSAVFSRLVLGNP